MENPDYLSGKRYADIMKTMWFTFFYSLAIPIGQDMLFKYYRFDIFLPWFNLLLLY
jgi:hypothetical protein